MGRRNMINAKLANQLRAYRDTLNRIEIHSYDWLHDIMVSEAEQSYRKRSLRINSTWLDRTVCVEDE